MNAHSVVRNRSFSLITTNLIDFYADIDLTHPAYIPVNDVDIYSYRSMEWDVQLVEQKRMLCGLISLFGLSFC